MNVLHHWWKVPHQRQTYGSRGLRHTSWNPTAQPVSLRCHAVPSYCWGVCSQLSFKVSFKTALWVHWILSSADVRVKSLEPAELHTSSVCLHPVYLFMLLFFQKGKIPPPSFFRITNQRQPLQRFPGNTCDSYSDKVTHPRCANPLPASWDTWSIQIEATVPGHFVLFHGGVIKNTAGVCKWLVTSLKNITVTSQTAFCVCVVVIVVAIVVIAVAVALHFSTRKTLIGFHTSGFPEAEVS